MKHCPPPSISSLRNRKKDGSSTIDRMEFVNGLTRLGIVLNPSELRFARGIPKVLMSQLFVHDDFLSFMIFCLYLRIRQYKCILVSKV